MYCKNCGKEINNEQKFCIHCGQSISNSENRESQKKSRSAIPSDPWTAGRIIKTIAVIIFIGGIILFRFENSINSTAVDKNNDALSSYESGDYVQAITQLEQASQDAIGNETKIVTLVNLGYLYSSEGQSQEALNAFKQALDLISEGSFDFYLVSGEIAYLEGKPNAALLAYNKAYALKPTNYQINNALNLFYLDLDETAPQYADYEKALSYAVKARELQQSETTKVNLAIAHYMNGNYDETISMLLTSDYTAIPHLAYWIGLSYVQKEDLVSAKRFLKIAYNGGVEMSEEFIEFINSK